MRDNPIMAVSLPASPPNQVRSLKWRVLGRDRSLPHFGRKFYHFVMGLFCASLYAFVLDREQALLTLGIVGGAWICLDLIRLRNPRANELTLRIFGKLMRREELKSISGNTFYILGITTIVFFFPKPIVLLSVLYLAIGDPVAAIVGTLWGRNRLIGKKSLEGAVANLLFSALATALVAVFYFHFTPYRTLALAAFGGLISSVVELFPLPIDDNFTIPVLAAILLSTVNSIFPLL